MTRRYGLPLLFVLALAVAKPALACSAPKPGAGLRGDQLVRYADTIVLVRLQSRAQWEHDADLTKYILETVESIKGTGNKTYEFLSFGSGYSGEDFRGHQATAFWSKDVGRSVFPCCICGPDHSFREGDTYLYFPDLLGAMKSAELVRGAGDKWLAYVRAGVKAAANPTVDRDARKNGARPSPSR